MLGEHWLEPAVRALAPDHWRIGLLHLHLGQAYFACQQLSEAEPHLATALRVLSSSQGTPLVERHIALTTLVDFYSALGNAAEAEKYRVLLAPRANDATPPDP